MEVVQYLKPNGNTELARENIYKNVLLKLGIEY